jgi:hypothetical protein
METETLQMLITKFLDGEITSDERKILQTYLDKAPEAQKLFQQMKQLNHESQQAVADEVLNKGLAFDDIFEKAWQDSRTLPANKPTRLYRWANFAGGLAAGLMIGLAAHFVLLSAPSDTMSTPPISRIQGLPRRFERPSVIHNVDWYHLTNKAGEQWLIEGYRDDLATPAVYHGDL